MILPALTLALSLGCLVLFQRWLHRHLQGLLLLLTRKETIALGVYAVLFLPGVVLHEGSHYLAAKLLRVPTHGFSLIPRRAGKLVRFGYVETAAADPIRASLIGLAPLVAGVAAMLVLALNRLGLDSLAAAAVHGDLELIRQSIDGLLATPDLLLWLYLVFTISNTMLPSKSDRAAWLPAIGMLVLAAAALWFTGVGGAIVGQATQWARLAAEQLTGVFAVTAGLDALLLLPIMALESLLARLTGLQIVY